MPDEDKNKPGQAPADPQTPPEPTGGGGPADDKDAGLKTALHAERQARKEAERIATEAKTALEAAKANNAPPEVVERLAKVETQLARENAVKPFIAELGDPALAETAFGYYEKLAEGITDEAAKTEMRKRAVNLALMDKNPAVNPVTRMAGNMHSSSNRSSSAGAVTPGALEMAKQFGVDAEQLKNPDRPIKGLYNS